MIEMKILGMPPNVGAVVSYIDGKIAHRADVLFTAIILQRLPLLEEDELQKLLLGGIEKPVGPVNSRVKALVPLSRVAAATLQQPEALVEPSQDL